MDKNVIELPEEDLATLAKHIYEAVYIIQNKGKFPYIAYKGASNFCLATLISYADGITAMLKDEHGEEEQKEEKPQSKLTIT